MNNPQLFGLYLLCKEELEVTDSNAVQERMLFHATSPYNVERIVNNNFDWRKTSRARFGQGACFSQEARYAHKYASSKGGK